MWRRIVIQILFWLLKTPTSYQGINVKLANDWLARQHQDMGFREYFRMRDYQLLKIVGGGVGRTEYELTVGQRLELLGLLQKVETAFKIAAKKKEEIRINNKKNK